MATPASWSGSTSPSSTASSAPGRRQRLRQVDLPAPPARPGAAERAASIVVGDRPIVPRADAGARHRLPALFGVSASHRDAEPDCWSRTSRSRRSVRPRLRRHGASARATRPRRCWSRVGLAHARDRYPAQLSGGMQQRLAIAQTLLEPPADPAARRAVRRARSRHPRRHARAADRDLDRDTA